MVKTIVIFHDNCPDGFTSAWAAWKKFGDDAEYIPASFNGDGPPDLTGADVYIVDFSYPRDVTLAIKAEANALVVLDHHKSAKANLEGIEGCHFDMERSGAGMTWDYFHPDTPRPRLISYVEDRDLWRFSLPLSKEINAVITSYQFTFENWDALDLRLRADHQQVQEDGRAILRSKERYVEVMMKTGGRRVNFLGYDDVMMVNAPHISISELLNRLAQDAPFAVGWRQAADGMFLYSLRSTEEGVDVSEVASKAVTPPGGGHRCSAGFHSEKPPWELTTDVKDVLERLETAEDLAIDGGWFGPDIGDDIAQAVAGVKDDG